MQINQPVQRGVSISLSRADSETATRSVVIRTEGVCEEAERFSSSTATTELQLLEPSRLKDRLLNEWTIDDRWHFVSSRKLSEDDSLKIIKS